MANTIFFSYVGIYTRMKRISPINTSLGAVIGALPPILGWLAAGESILSPIPMCFFFF
jgi:protoheme IX farnesyltransferase